MNGCFQPVLRKWGVVTLLMACVFSAGWVRSFTISDQLSSNLLPAEAVLQSACGGLRCYFGDEGWNPESSICFWWSVPVREWLEDDSEEHADFDWFDIYQEDDKSISIVIPYWSIVLPLIALSAWLVLSIARPHEPSLSSTAEVRQP